MLTHEHKGRTWTEVGREPYTRKDGAQSELIRWRTACCASGCSAFVEIKSSAAGYERSKDFERKHCPAHKLTPEEVGARWSAGVKARRSVRDLI